jgi:uncharacterized protein YggE
MGKRRLLSVGAAIGLLAVIGVMVLGIPGRGGAALAQTQAGEPARTLTAVGSGEVRVQPDEATINLGVETRAQDARTALADNSTKMNTVIAAVKAQGVPDGQIATNGLSLNYDPERTTYVATHNLAVRLDGIDRVGPLLDAAVGAGATTSWGVSYGLKDASAARSQALKAAIADARRHADDMAAALGVTIAAVASAEDATYGVGPQFGKGAAGGGLALQPGQLSVTADVRVAYTFGG